VRVFNLAVDQAAAACAPQLYQCHEGHLGGVAHVRKHAFAEEHAAQGNAVEPPDQAVPVIVDLDRVRMTGPEQRS
jgi:hypothetical protein